MENWGKENSDKWEIMKKGYKGKWILGKREIGKKLMLGKKENKEIL